MKLDAFSFQLHSPLPSKRKSKAKSRKRQQAEKLQRPRLRNPLLRSPTRDAELCEDAGLESGLEERPTKRAHRPRVEEEAPAQAEQSCMEDSQPPSPQEERDAAVGAHDHVPEHYGVQSAVGLHWEEGPADDEEDIDEVLRRYALFSWLAGVDYTNRAPALQNPQERPRGGELRSYVRSRRQDLRTRSQPPPKGVSIGRPPFSWSLRD
jgi:hypothetical protein